ncbi:hypothetical protein ACFFSH_39385 [Streptomyces filamentosus]|uniref:Uncharacterized protein n=1 Tax=Streptomyces filamentosus TaxID=67294 RepID=A0A919BVI1_STRFL|nr:hypothetical protein [Streptomyces filamentosus]GHG15397.1 hypothetical protein GCM10017667_56190 [Streptomyces filamentosus]
MSDDITPDDIAAIRKEDGGLRALMRAQIAIGRARQQVPAQKTARRPTGRPPGAWPTGTTPKPQQPVQYPPGAWEAALGEYREWLRTADHPEFMDEGQTCGCTGCTPLTQKEDQ